VGGKPPPPNLDFGRIEDLELLTTACPREVVARGGHPLGLILDRGYDRKSVPGFFAI
jgi:hypothetical protein